MKHNRPTIDQLKKVGGHLVVDGKEYSIRPNGSLRVRSMTEGPSKTRQSFRDEVDANLIVAKYNKNLHRERFEAHPDMYRDLSKQPTYAEALNVIREADSAFQSLPSKTRALFENNPDKLLEFIHNPKNYDEGVKIGLFKPKPIPKDPSPQPTSQSQSTSQPQTTSTTSKPSQT